jgi:parallel beta-helix repeat protein
MKSTKILATIYASLLTFGFLGTVSPSEGKVLKVACSAKKTLNAFIPRLNPGDTVVVTGTCHENVVIPSEISEITIDGQGTAIINAVVPTAATLINRGMNNTIKNLTITGAQTAIQVQRSSSMTIDSVVISGVGETGIAVNGSSFARIVNSTIQNNVNGNGITVTENSSARIGYLTNNDTTALPNTITGNDRGVVVSESSSATIVGNTISNNLREGILVNAVSHADIASNTINGNGNNGIHVGRNSGVDLGSDSGTSIFEVPNSTTSGSENVGFGLRCFINSYADRRLGSLNGTLGQKDAFTGGCIDSTIP